MKIPPLHLIGSFLAFSESRNMQEAADNLELSQPALTAHLKLFEDYFSQQIFGQTGRRKTLTPFGVQLKEIFSKRFANLGDEVKALHDRVSRPEDVILRIAGRGEIINYVAPKIRFPGRLFFHEQDGAEAVNGVLSRKYDLAISNHTMKAANLYAKKLFTDQFCVLAPRKWVNERKHLSQALFKDLLSHHYLSYKEKDVLLTTVLKHFNLDSPLQPNRVLAHWPNLVTMVELGLGWTIAPSRYAPGSATVSLPISFQLVPETQFYIFYQKELSSLPWFKTLIEEFRGAAA